MARVNPANNIVSGLSSTGDRSADIEQLINQVALDCGFIPTSADVHKSHWWNSRQFGAVVIEGKYQNHDAILKLQLHQLDTSEATMITALETHSRSQLVRPPHLYLHKPWNSSIGYEVMVLEQVSRTPILKPPADSRQVENFFEIYRDYRENCLGQPWVSQPSEPYSQVLAHRFETWIGARERLYPDHSLLTSDDKQLIQSAVHHLVDGFSQARPEFVHGHFSCRDLRKADGQVVLLSNLYWSWRHVGYDAVFGFFWYMIELAGSGEVTVEAMEKQRRLWLDQIESLPQFQGEGRKHLELALLERAVAGLNLGILSIDPGTVSSQWMFEWLRGIIRQALD